MDQTTPTKTQKTNLPLIIILSFLIIAIISLIVAIIIVNSQPITSTIGETPAEAELEEIFEDINEPSKGSSTLDCTKEMSAEEVAELNAVSGKIEVVADFTTDDSLALIAIYKTIITPSTDIENPDAPGDEFLVENSSATSDTLKSSDYPTYYLTENDTSKSKAKSSWTSQGFTCLDQSDMTGE